MRMGNFEGKRGRPIGRRTYDCTVPGWHCTIISPPSIGSIGLRQPLSELFIPEKCIGHTAQGAASMRQEEPTALK